jgi:hypothetical protein
VVTAATTATTVTIVVAVVPFLFMAGFSWGRLGMVAEVVVWVSSFVTMFVSGSAVTSRLRVVRAVG